MAKTIRVGILGVGVMGAEHARILAGQVSGAEVAAVYDIDTARASVVAASVGTEVTDDAMLLIKDDAIDAVLIASADATHEEFVLATLAADKPVLCEKPLAPTLSGCRRILDAEVAVGRRLISVGFMRRFDPGYLAMRADVAAGTIGAPLIVHCIHRNVANPVPESATLITGSVVHEIDIVRWLLDDEFTAVTIHCPRPSGNSNGLQDPIVAVFETVSGAHVDVEVFGNAGYGYDVRCELVGETGTVQLALAADVARRGNFAASEAIARDWRDRFGEAYRCELQDWIDAVAADRPARTAHAWDGYVATVVAEAGVRALQTGATVPVDVPDRPALYA